MRGGWRGRSGGGCARPRTSFATCGWWGRGGRRGSARRRGGFVPGGGCAGRQCPSARTGGGAPGSFFHDDLGGLVAEVAFVVIAVADAEEAVAVFGEQLLRAGAA